MNKTVSNNESFLNQMKHNSVKLITAAVIFISFFIIANIIKYVIQKRVAESTDKMTKKKKVIGNISSIIYYLLIFIGLILALFHIGFDTAGLVTIFGSMGLAFALSLQGLLGDLCNGFFLSYSTNFEIGDYIILDNGKEGVVTDFSLFATTLTAFSTPVIIPNSIVTKSTITNINKGSVYTALLDFTLSNNDPISAMKMIELVNKSIGKSDLVKDHKKIQVTVLKADGSGTTYRVHVPLASTNTYNTENAVRTMIREELYDEGLLLLDNNYIGLHPSS